jgi:hypothetical protein
MCETRRLRKKAKRLKGEVKFLKSVLKSKLISAGANTVPSSKSRSIAEDIVPPMGTGK